MKVTNIKRVFRAGFVNFWRNGSVSLASILISTVTLSVITALIFLQAILHFSLEQVKDKVDVTIYFTTNASEDKISALKSSIEKLPEVEMATYTSQQQALEEFKARHADDYLTLQALEELDENPLGATLNIKAKETSQYESIAKFLESDTALTQDATTIIDKINYNQNKVVIDRLTSIIDGAQKLGYVVTLVLIGICILITFNTIRLTIYIAREEIGIMRLVGASNTYIRGPFLVEGMIYGVISSFITMLIFWPVSAWLGSHMTDFFGMNIFDYYTANFVQILLILIGTGIVLGSISSGLAIRRYLRK
jgi:cell division transport system permease protein